MASTQTWNATSLERLRRMLGSVIDERELLEAVDPTRAAHLADAAVDLQTLISRLEQETEPVATSAPSVGRSRMQKATLRPSNREHTRKRA